MAPIRLQLSLHTRCLAPEGNAPALLPRASTMHTTPPLLQGRGRSRSRTAAIGQGGTWKQSKLYDTATLRLRFQQPLHNMYGMHLKVRVVCRVGGRAAMNLLACMCVRICSHAMCVR